MASIAMRRHGNGEEDSEITITKLSREERELIEAMLLGYGFVGTSPSRKIVHFPSFNALPDPVDDPHVSAHWQRKPGVEPAVQVTLPFADNVNRDSWCYPSIVIEHLCGYYYTEENYKKEAAKLTSYGFECLRSRRHPDGCYREAWVLSGDVWMAGDLRDAIDPKLRGYAWSDAVVKFLQRNCSFGTLDVTVQKLAMVIE